MRAWGEIAGLAVLVLLAIALPGCGGGSGGTDGSTSSGSEVQIEADPDGALAYVPTEAEADAGTITIAFHNPQPLAHVVKLEDAKGNTVGETATIIEESTSVPVTLGPGTYTYYCSVPGYRRAGMEGTLVVH